ncbi:MAG: hypothetical protein ABL898_16630 [Hyphomicrobiaceae bacterium]
MQGSLSKRVLIGIIAAVLSVVVFHQGVVWGITQAGLAKLEPWSMKAVAPYGVPTILNSMFWGGLWGALFGAIVHTLPGGALWLRGLIYGLGVLVVSNWILLPLIKGSVFGLPNQVYFSGGVPLRMMIGAMILGGFGIGLGLLYGALGGRSARV